MSATGGSYILVEIVAMESIKHTNASISEKYMCGEENKDQRQGDGGDRVAERDSVGSQGGLPGRSNTWVEMPAVGRQRT